jgi:hypothetical protein
MLESSASSSHPGGKLGLSYLGLPAGDAVPTSFFEAVCASGCDLCFCSSRVHRVEVKVRVAIEVDRNACNDVVPTNRVLDLSKEWRAGDLCLG